MYRERERYHCIVICLSIPKLPTLTQTQWQASLSLTVFVQLPQLCDQLSSRQDMYCSATTNKDCSLPGERCKSWQSGR